MEHVNDDFFDYVIEQELNTSCDNGSRAIDYKSGCCRCEWLKGMMSLPNYDDKDGNHDLQKTSMCLILMMKILCV